MVKLVLIQIQLKNFMKLIKNSLAERYAKIPKEIQKKIPIRVSIPQTIEWLINVGQQQINSELQNADTKRISQQK